MGHDCCGHASVQGWPGSTFVGPLLCRPDPRVGVDLRRCQCWQRMSAGSGKAGDHFGDALGPAVGVCWDWQGGVVLWMSFGASQGCLLGLADRGSHFGGASAVLDPQVNLGLGEWCY